MKAYPGTYGAVLLGAFGASGLSGIVTAQFVIYLKLFPSDRKSLKSLVFFVWTLSLTHMALVWEAMWEYCIANFGETRFIDFIPRGIALSVVLTATLTFLAHCLFAHRIYYLSERKIYLTVPIIILAFARLAAATVSGIEMIHLGRYSLFRERFLWLFTLGLSLSCTVDIMITVLLFFFLEKNRKGIVGMQRIVDSIALYAFEINSLTSATTVASMICWVTLNDSLVFLGLHFVIGQLYANSLFASLNSRHGFRRAHSSLDRVKKQNGPDLQVYVYNRQRGDMDHDSNRNSVISPARDGFKENEALSSPASVTFKENDILSSAV